MVFQGGGRGRVCGGGVVKGMPALGRAELWGRESLGPLCG